MSTNETLKLIESLEEKVTPYLTFDNQVNGLVSKSLKTLTEIRTLLQNPTPENLQNAQLKGQQLREDLTPYLWLAPDIANKIDLILDKLK